VSTLTETRLRILHLEDNPADAELVQRTLTAAGLACDMLRVETREQFEAALNQGGFDLILADKTLPQYDGLSALALAREKRPAVPFIFVSGTLGEEVAIESLKNGATDYVLKQRLSRLVPVTRRAMREAAERTARQKTEAERRRLSAAVESAAEAIVITDVAGRIEYVNPAFEQITGYRSAEVVGQNPRILQSGEQDEGFYRVMWDTLTRAQVWQASLVNRKRDGTTYHVEETISPVLDAEGHIVSYVAVQHDVTQRVRAEEALAASEAELRSLFAAMTDIVLVLDSEGRYLQIAPTNPALLVKAPAEMLGRTLHEVMPETDAANILRSIRRALELQQPIQVEYSLTIGDATLWFDGTVSPMGTDKVFWIARDVTERKRAEAQIQQHLQHLAALRSIDMTINSSLDLRVTLNVLLDQVVEQLHAHAATVLLLNPSTLMLEFAAGRGFRSRPVERARLRLGDMIAGRVALERTLMAMPDLSAVELPPALGEMLRAENFVSYVGVPLIAKGQVKGILEIWQRQPLDPDLEWLNFFEALAAQAAIAIDNAQLLDGLQRSNTDLGLAYDTTIEGWSRALDLRDKETEGHTQRVSELTLHLAREMGLPDEQLVHIRRGALLHDIGKMGVPDSILLKPGPLNDEEWTLMKRHPTLAYELLSPVAYLRRALDIPYCHHEKWDGTGYPRGLKGEQIPLTARLFAVVDVWDALRSDRPYRPAWPQEKVRAHLQSLAGTHFDPKVVMAFLRLV
jgi:PAS domain S-box-containing protein/putative nucleotidyltransferase with HDIG domain